MIHCIGGHLPDHAVGRDEQHAWQVLENLAGREVAGEAGEAFRLDAPEWPSVRSSLRRAEGEST